ncbi:MAG: sigma 54-interacting transcriptional regulator [Planctomycetota bacterium]
MHVRLTILQGKDAGQPRHFHLNDQERILLGRGDDCGMLLWDESASRHHAALERSGDQLELIDLGSSNGTMVDGRRTERQRVTGGERLTIGATEIRLEIGNANERPTTVLRPERDFWVESTLARDAIDLGGRLASDAQHRNRLNQLLEFVERSQDAEDGETILRGLLERASAALGAARVSIVPVASRSREPLWTEALHGGAGAPPEVSRSVVRHVVDDGTAVQVRDVEADPRTRERASLVGRRVGSVLAVPVAGRGRTHAVLYLENGSDRRFAEEDLAYAATLGQVAGMALESAERLQQSRRVLHTRERARDTEFLTRSAALLSTLERLARFAASGGPVLIHGETGTGKELLARQAHREGPFPNGPWIPVNCAAIPSSLLESELFGHEKGAFTGATGRKAGMFELAHEGTLFLDEIGDMPLELQSKLLRVLESGEFYRIGGAAPVSVRLLVVSATHRDLSDRVSSGQFREDLFFRLNRFQVAIPPLRDRPEDIPLLADNFLRAAAKRRGVELRFSPEAEDALSDYDWPGNVRELRNVIERGTVLAHGSSLEPGDLVISARTRPSSTAVNRIGLASILDAAATGPEPPSLDAVEEAAIRQVMEYTGGKKGEAAQILGIAWPTLRRKLRKYGMDSSPGGS